jgi:methionyl-tRNA formyltransferase
MRIVFLGTPEFAVPSLQALVKSGHEMTGIFTQPDRPKGRGGEVAESPVKIAARRLGIPVYQPERIRSPENLEIIHGLAPEMMVVVGYGQIIPQTLINLPPHGILNVHASLLPKYRGAAPIQWAIANGEIETGVTIMQIDAGLDTGDILLQRSTPIGPHETAPELAARLAPLGAELLIEAIDQITNGTARPRKQDEQQATYAPLLKKEDGRIDWTQPAGSIYNRLRGFKPWPGVYTTFRGQQLSVLGAKPAGAGSIPPGILQVHKGHLVVGCGEGSILELHEVQPAGRKPMSAQAFINGYRIAENEKLGD